jgi:hypothetical protein
LLRKKVIYNQLHNILFTLFSHHNRFDFMPYHDEYFDLAGFDRQAVMSLLTTAGLSPDLNNMAGEISKPESKWGAALPLVKWFTVNDAAAIFAGYHQDEIAHVNYNEEPREVSDARKMLWDAVNAGEIENRPNASSASTHHPRVGTKGGDLRSNAIQLAESASQTRSSRTRT